MGFWNDQEKFETKRAFRWVAVFNNIASWTIKSVSKPSLSVSETSHRFMNHTYYYPGRVEWSTIDLSLVDPLNPDATKTILHMIEASGYNPNIGINSKYKTVSKTKATSALNDLRIRQLDAEGKDVEIWTLKHPWVKDVKFGNLSYDSDDLIDINITIRFDWCKVWTKFDGVPLNGPGDSPSAADHFPSDAQHS
jgi:hypothetical protein